MCVCLYICVCMFMFVCVCTPVSSECVFMSFKVHWMTLFILLHFILFHFLFKKLLNNTYIFIKYYVSTENLNPELY